MNIFFRITTWPFRKIFGRKKEPELDFNTNNISGGQQYQAQPIQSYQGQQPYSKQEDFLKDYGQGYSGREQNYDKPYQSADKQEIILSKLEVINAKLDNINQRLQALERNREKLW